MTIKRERMTWLAAGRKASAPPALPGYGKEDQDHPAHYPDPEAHDYENGDTSSWNEDPAKPPYKQGNPPALPGYDTEDQDHPAHVNPPRNPKEARSLKAAVQKKAAKCVKLAELMLKNHPRKTAEMIEDQALDLMDLPDSQIDMTFNRLAGGFLADDEDILDDSATLSAELDELLGGAEDECVQASETPKVAMEDIMLAIKKLADDVDQLKGGKQADQNDPKGPTLAPKPKTEEEARKEAKKSEDDEEDGEDDEAVKEFDSYDTKKSGFLMKAEWKGSKAVFAALDSDRDGIIARVDLIKMACGCEEAPMAAKSADLDPEEQALLAELETEEPVVEEAPLAACDQGFDDGFDDGQDDLSMFGLDHDPMGLADEPVASHKSADDELLGQIFDKFAKKGEDDEEEEDEPKEAKKASKKSEEDDEEEDEPKEAKGKKGSKKSEEDEEEDDELKGSKKASVRTASQRPQPKKASAGVRSVGNVPKVANTGEIAELSKLWESSPDVSDVFGI